MRTNNIQGIGSTEERPMVLEIMASGLILFIGGMALLIIGARVWCVQWRG